MVSRGVINNSWNRLPWGACIGVSCRECIPGRWLTTGHASATQDPRPPKDARHSRAHASSKARPDSQSPGLWHERRPGRHDQGYIRPIHPIDRPRGRALVFRDRAAHDRPTHLFTPNEAQRRRREDQLSKPRQRGPGGVWHCSGSWFRGQAVFAPLLRRKKAKARLVQGGPAQRHGRRGLESTRGAEGRGQREAFWPVVLRRYPRSSHDCLFQMRAASTICSLEGQTGGMNVAQSAS